MSEDVSSQTTPDDAEVLTSSAADDVEAVETDEAVETVVPEADDAVEPPPAPAVLSGGIVPPPFGLPDEQPARASEPASTPTPRTLATRRRPDRRMRERVMRMHLHDQAEHSPPAQQEPPTLPAGHNNVTTPTKVAPPPPCQRLTPTSSTPP